MKKNLVTAAATAGLIITAFGTAANAQENTYTVQPGDSLWKIAQVNNVSIDHLKAWNHLSSDNIYVNQKLTINYTVQSGDTLWAIAKSQGTTVSELKNANGLTNDLIQIGQQLKIPVSNTSASVSSTNSIPATYVVQKGDCLSSIGARYHLSVSELKSMNQLTSNKIIIGRILQLRSDRAAAMSDAAASTAEQSEGQPTPSQAAVNSAESDSSAKSAAPAASQPAEQPASPAASKPAAPATSQAAPAPAPAAPAASQPAPAPAPATPQAAAKPASAGTSNTEAVIAEAEKFIGTPYLWGGTTPSGFDCSGFIQYVFNKEGISLPRTTSTQWNATTPVSSPSVGDLVFFQTYQSGPSHVGIYLGNNKFISAQDNGVKISDMTLSYWASRYLGARKAF